MTVQEMRKQISSAYDSDSWRKRVANMSDKQIIAIHMKFKLAGKIK